MYDVLSAIVVTISEEMSRLMNCVTNFNENGAMQARLDLMALTLTLSNYFTPNSKYNKRIMSVYKIVLTKLDLFVTEIFFVMLLTQCRHSKQKIMKSKQFFILSFCNATFNC